MTTKCIIVDDEPIAIEIVREHLSRLDDIQIVAECKNAVEAFEVVRKKKVDLIFLDIKMPQMTGIEFLKTISYPPAVIITTAYRNYAIEGFELNVIDYLLKPISFERFMKAMDKFYITRANKSITLNSEKVAEEESFIYIKEGKEVHKVHLNKILYIESYKDQITIYFPEGELKTYYRIGDIDQQLPSDQFIRSHKSFIVSKWYINSFTTKTITIGDKKIPIGITYREAVMQQLEFNL